MAGDGSGVASHKSRVTEKDESGDSHVTAVRGGRNGGHPGSEFERQNCQETVLYHRHSPGNTVHFFICGLRVKSPDNNNISLFNGSTMQLVHAHISSFATDKNIILTVKFHIIQ